MGSKINLCVKVVLSFRVAYEEKTHHYWFYRALGAVKLIFKIFAPSKIKSNFRLVWILCKKRESQEKRHFFFLFAGLYSYACDRYDVYVIDIYI